MDIAVHFDLNIDDGRSLGYYRDEEGLDGKIMEYLASVRRIEKRLHRRLEKQFRELTEGSNADR